MRPKWVFLRYLAEIGLLALIYFIFGKLGLRFATTQKHVTLLWAPTGIALCAVLLRGYRVWPGLVLGAFLVNITTDHSLGVGLATAVGNPLEAICGAAFERSGILIARCAACRMCSPWSAWPAF